ncbi:MAG TPA: hypothetical protein VFQ39_05410, partial [Longimicrobium sp.]|nr:hypothetical protein [Longimicrobium sp.]
MLPHLLENLGNGADRFALSAAAPRGWTTGLFLDRDGDGVLGAADQAVSGPLPLARGESAALLLVIDVPADAPDAGDVAIDVKATSQSDTSVASTVRDLVTVHRPLPALTLGKAVDRSAATPGDTLTWTLSWANQGDAPTTAAVLADTLPAGARFVPGSLRLNGLPLTDAVDADSGAVARGPTGREAVRVGLPPILPGATGQLVFRTIIAADAAGDLDNVATLAWGEVILSSPHARTQVAPAALTVAKERLGEGTVRVGETVRYRVSWGNASSVVSVRDAVLTDTLPEALSFVSATGQPEVEGRVVRWRLGTLAPSAAGSVEVVARLERRPEDPMIVNRVVARGANAEAVSAAAAAFEARDFNGDELEIAKQAGVLEASLGDAVPYALTLTNRGTLTVRGIVVHDRLPEGVRWMADRVSGADSVSVDGRDVTFVVDSLAGGEGRVIRYAVTIVSPGDASSLANRATARAEGGRVVSDTAIAYVRLRRGFAMQNRVVVGKVWADADGDGRQGRGEPGIG